MTESRIAPNARCLIYVNADDSISCLGTVRAGRITADTTVRLRKGDGQTFNSLDYDQIREFLDSQPERTAVAFIENGRIQLAPHE